MLLFHHLDRQLVEDTQTGNGDLNRTLLRRDSRTQRTQNCVSHREGKRGHLYQREAGSLLGINQLKLSH